MDTLQGKVALVTGAASGIGAGTARALAARGVRLVLLDVAAEPLATVADELGALGVVADVRDLDAVQAAVDAGVERFGGIDLVLANAGIASYGSVLAVDPEDFRRVLEVNLLGVFHTVRAALPSVLERRGYILVVSSLAAFAAAAGYAAYGASKAGVEHFANTLRIEVASRGVDVGCAHMTWIDTPLLRDVHSDLPSSRRIQAEMPRPLRKTLPLQTCVDAFVAAFERRSPKVYVPRWVGVIGWLRALLTTRLGSRADNRMAAEFLPKIDAEVAALGRSTSARNAILDRPDPT
ncbi:MAG TPA: SDR family oxidoreductase [Aldersonia sp.]